MAEITSRRNCINHPDRLGEMECDLCGEAMCTACHVDAIAADREYCSIACAREAESGAAERYRAGVERPYATGLVLWRDSLRGLAMATLPAAVVIGVAVQVDPGLLSDDPDAAAAASPWVTLAVFLAFVYGILVAQVTLSQQHTELIDGSPHAWVLRRIVPWALTWLLVLVGTVFGYFLLVIPGIILGLRLFWADELALAHRLGPLRAAQESWAITKGRARDLFSFQFVAGLFAWVAVFGALMVAVYPVGFAAGVVGLGSDGVLLFAMTWVFFMAYAAVHAVQVAKFYGTLAEYRLAGWEPAPADAWGTDEAPGVDPS